MSRHVVLGAGPIGRAITTRLLADGHQTVVATRSGTQVPGAHSVRLAGADPRLREVLDGAASLIIATNPPYHAWEEEWPPLVSNAVEAAAHTGADLVLIGNLYAHAPGASPMTAATPLAPTTRKGAVRARIWEQLLAAQEAGRVRVTEIRASDYCGPEALATPTAHAGKRFVEPLLAGRTAYVIGDLDAPHSWTAVDDIAATAVATLDAEAAWGRPWVVPTDDPRSLRQMAQDLTSQAGLTRTSVRRYPRLVLRGLELMVPMMRELREIAYQHDQPFISDGSETTQALGVTATPWPEVIAATVAAARPERRSPLTPMNSGQ